MRVDRGMLRGILIRVLQGCVDVCTCLTYFPYQKGSGWVVPSWGTRRSFRSLAAERTSRIAVGRDSFEGMEDRKYW